jgi:hypothetical protein
MSQYDKDEVEWTKRIFKDNPGTAEVDGIQRKEVEKMVYAKRALILQNYNRFENKNETVKILIEMLYKLH